MIAMSANPSRKKSVMRLIWLQIGKLAVNKIHLGGLAAVLK